MKETMKMRKVENNGKVAVLYSPGYGAGWYTWNRHAGEQLIYDPMVVEWVLADKPNNHMATAVFDYLQQQYSGVCTSGMKDLEVKWLPVATRFRINEYDGSEGIVVDNEEEWHTV